ncbi:MAG: MarR family winged helix-turn-helix transcriptional regulator [Candidatus Cyclobacteriaceae bacterium M2_1C_046]
MKSIGELIHQQNFRSEYLKADINLIYTTSFLSGQKNCILKKFGISMQQFNILRILKGLNGEPASVKLLTERMLDKMSNASRLVEKLKNKGLVRRNNCPDDRRQVEIFITEKGLSLTDEATRELENELMNRQHLTESEAGELNRLLDKMRGI